MPSDDGRRERGSSRSSYVDRARLVWVAASHANAWRRSFVFSAALFRSEPRDGTPKEAWVPRSRLRAPRESGVNAGEIAIELTASVMQESVRGPHLPRRSVSSHFNLLSAARTRARRRGPYGPELERATATRVAGGATEVDQISMRKEDYSLAPESCSDTSPCAGTSVSWPRRLNPAFASSQNFSEVSMRSIRRVSIGPVLLCALLAGCAVSPVVQLNDPARSKAAPDVANLLPARDIPYESLERSGAAVSYNLFFAKSSAISAYRLTLVMRNTSSSVKVFEPKVRLQDGSGLVIPPYTYQAFVAEAAILAGTPIPPAPAAYSNFYDYGTRQEHSGTIRDLGTGRSYSYTGTTTSPSGGFGAGFAQGMAAADAAIAQGAAAQAAADRDQGRLMLRWANAYWLRAKYEVPPGGAVSGGLFFPAAGLGVLPLKLLVEIDGEKFEFVTTATR